MNLRDVENNIACSNHLIERLLNSSLHLSLIRSGDKSSDIQGNQSFIKKLGRHLVAYNQACQVFYNRLFFGAWLSHQERIRLGWLGKDIKQTIQLLFLA